jgi:8-oxo-dGTP pyrophosphatase MutT (NUDIX family)
VQVTVSSQPGSDRPNEDHLAVGRDMIVVLDGATARTETGCIHGVAWYVRHLADAIIGHPDLPPADALALAIVQTANQHRGCDLDHPGTPSAAVAIAQARHGVLRYLVLGDVTIVAETRDGLQVITDDRVNQTARAERVIADALPNGSPEKTEALVRMKHAELAARNTPGGFWIATADPRVVKHAIIGEIPLADLRRIALLTDGATRAVNPLKICDWPGVMDLLSSAGPAELIRQVRAAESNDPDATRWPRNKVHDDATAAAVEFGGSEGQSHHTATSNHVLSGVPMEATIRATEPRDDTETEPSTVPEPRPVVAAIVTSCLGVLVARRNDGKPPWTFVAGEIEPGESPADAAVREVKEETGLQIRSGGVIGRRVHPRTGRTMVYIAAQPVQGTSAFVSDEQELAEVRWVSLAQADELMGGTIFEPVRKHLRRMLEAQYPGEPSGESDTDSRG